MRQPVDLVTDPDAYEPYNDLDGQREIARTLLAIAKEAAVVDDVLVAKRQAEFDAVTAKAKKLAGELRDKGVAVRMVFESIGALNYEALIDEHPPTDEQRAAAEAAGGTAAWNPDTFLDALVAASCVDPELTVDQVAVLRKSPNWNGTEFNQLVAAAILVNTGKARVDLGKDFGRTRPTA